MTKRTIRYTLKVELPEGMETAEQFLMRAARVVGGSLNARTIEWDSSGGMEVGHVLLVENRRGGGAR